MSFSIVVRTEAQIDLDEIFIWYEEQQVGLGLQFIQGIDDVYRKSNVIHLCFSNRRRCKSSFFKKIPL